VKDLPKNIFEQVSLNFDVCDLVIAGSATYEVLVSDKNFV